MVTYLRIAQLLIAIVLIVAILLQSKGTGLGSFLGGDGGIYRTRRGVERTLFNLTILLAAVFFVVSTAAVILQ